MERLTEIVSLAPSEYDNYIQNRIDSMPQVDYFCPDSARQGCVKTDKLFGKDSRFISGYADLVVDDNEIYHILFDNIKHFAKNVDLRDKNARDQVAISAVQRAVFDYYGVGKPTGCSPTDVDNMRINLYRDAWFREQSLSIRDFRGQRLSMCNERSCLAHNFFKILGYDSRLVAGNINLGLVGGSTKRELHSYNMVKLSDGAHIYDLVCTPQNYNQPMPNPVMCKLDDTTASYAFDNLDSMPEPNIPKVQFVTQKGNTYEIAYHTSLSQTQQLN